MYDVFTSVIIAAAGSGTRMGNDIPKQFLKIGSRTVLEYSLKAFSEVEEVKEIVVTTRAEDLFAVEEYKSKYPKIKAVVSGGKTRQDSVKNAVAVISEDSELIAIHDAARPLITQKEIREIIGVAIEKNAVCPVSAVTDTVKRTNEGIIAETLDRNSLFLASTPQVFKTDIYKKALHSLSSLESFTDDCSLVESVGQPVSLYIMKNKNTKITTPEDFIEVKNILEKDSPSLKIGHGYDVHRLTEGRDLILGGVKIPNDKGLLGHSDADVLVHAIMDSLLGALGMGDIGRLFPDTDEEFKGISSILLLERVSKLLEESGFKVSNIDATVIAQAPRLSPYIPHMRLNIANALSTSAELVNLKATTEEKLGFTGEKLGISAHSVCIISKK